MIVVKHKIRHKSFQDVAADFSSRCYNVGIVLNITAETGRTPITPTYIFGWRVLACRAKFRSMKEIYDLARY
jgi:hypothetical protein